MIKTGKELATACLNVANNYKTLYVMGCFGAPMNKANQDRYIAHHEYNRREARTKMIRAASADTFGFDCVCMIKGLLWGWDGDTSHVYGGAKYGSNGVPDIGTEQIIGVCKDVSTDFSKIEVGELLWMKGHVGIYVGDGNCVECTPGWKNCVQVTVVKNVKAGSGHNWTKHGKLPYVSYDGSTVTTTPATTTSTGSVKATADIPVLKKGSKGDSVKALQILLIGYGYSCGSSGVDGSFGGATEKAVKAFQEDNSLEVDASVGPLTWAKLLGVK